MNKLTKAYPVRLTKDQNKAIEVLESKGFNRSKLIRCALDYYLYAEYRNLLNKIKQKESRIPNAPSWFYN